MRNSKSKVSGKSYSMTQKNTKNEIEWIFYILKLTLYIQIILFIGKV